MNSLYWINVLDSFGTTIFTVLVFLSIAFVTLLFYIFIIKADNDEPYTNYKKHVKILGSIVGTLLLLNIFIPSKKDLYIIYGIGTVIDYGKNSKEVQKLPDNAVKALINTLKKLIMIL